tara:strand:- start:10360 stop:10941 length:582 start_codon:yes stop_codon:yes gene_type:complete
MRTVRDAGTIRYDASMDETGRDDLRLLMSKRWDPRRGVGRRMGALRAWLTTLFLLLIVFGRFILVGLPAHPAWSSIYLLPAVGLMLCWLVPIGIRRRTGRRVDAHGGFLCPWCRYPLTGLADAGVCPECGAGYERPVCAMLYRCAYRAFQPDQHELARREREAWTRAIEIRDTGSVRAGSVGPQPAAAPSERV